MGDNPKIKVDPSELKKGVIFWNNNDCQTCYAVLDLDSKFSLTTDRAVAVKLTLRTHGGQHILKIMEEG